MNRRLAGFVLAVSLALPASAHETKDPRVIVVTLQPDGLDLRINEVWDVGKLATDARRNFDKDGDRKLSYEEQESLKRFARSAMTSNLQVHASGRRLNVERVATKMRGVGGRIDAPEPLSVDLAARVGLHPSDKGRLTAELADYRSDDHEVHVVVVVPEGIEIVRHSSGKLKKDGRAVTGIRLSRKASLALSWRVSH